MGKQVIHYADKADIEIGTAKCGVRINGGTTHTAEKGRVTCPRCDSSLAAAKYHEAAEPAADDRSRGERSVGPAQENYAEIERMRNKLRQNRIDRIMYFISKLISDAERQGDYVDRALWKFLWRKIEAGAEAHFIDAQMEKAHEAVSLACSEAKNKDAMIQNQLITDKYLADEQRVNERLEGYARAIDKKEAEFEEQAAKLRADLESANGKAEYYRVRSAMMATVINELGNIVRHDSRL